MMSTQMNNCGHVGFQRWESQTCETLALQWGKKYFSADTHFVIVSPSPSISSGFHSQTAF